MKRIALYHSILSLSIAIMVSTFSSNSMAQPLLYQAKGQENSQEKMHREPPPQAYDACKGKKLNDSVEITTPRGDKIKAQCTESPKGLFARPERPPRREDGDDHDRRPPEKRQERTN